MVFTSHSHIWESGGTIKFLCHVGSSGFDMFISSKSVFYDISASGCTASLLSFDICRSFRGLWLCMATLNLRLWIISRGTCPSKPVFMYLWGNVWAKCFVFKHTCWEAESSGSLLVVMVELWIVAFMIRESTLLSFPENTLHAWTMLNSALCRGNSIVLKPIR